MDRPGALKERESLYKLLIGMAAGGYAYDPSAARSDTIDGIASHLALVGLPVDPDTVRKWIKAAAELLPPKQQR